MNLAMSGQPRILKTRPAETRPAGGDVAKPTSDQAPPQGPGRQGPPPFELVSKEWQLRAEEAVAQLPEDSDFFVVGVLGGPGIGKSSFLNALIGAREFSTCPPFPVATVEQGLAGQHCTSGIQLRVSEDGIIALDTQPLFSLSVLAEVARWDRPSLALAAPALAAASAAKASVAPFEAAQQLMELQMGALLLSVCHLVVVLCDGLHDEATWEFLQTVEMLARNIPDPTLPPPPGAAPAGGKAPPPQQQPAAQYLGDVLLVHAVAPAGEGAASCGGCGACSECGAPSEAEVAELEGRLRAYFGGSLRLRQPGPISLLDFLRGGGAAPSPSAPAPAAAGQGGGRLSYWVLERNSCQQGSLGGAAAEASAGEGDRWREALLARLLRYPRRPFARRASARAWGAGCAAAWDAVCRSPDVLDYYGRLVRTVYKGAGGWALAR